MQKRSKIILIIYFSILGFSAIGINLSKQDQYGSFEVSLEDIVRTFTLTRTTDLPIEKIYDTMSDIENYDMILKNNVHEVRIINQTDTFLGMITFAELDVSEAGVVTTLIVKHETRPYDTLIISVMGGDTHGTTITQTFTEKDSETEIISDALIRVKGILTPFGFLPQYNFEHALNTVFDTFIEYAENES